jgi:hypothetical protein
MGLGVIQVPPGNLHASGHLSLEDILVETQHFGFEYGVCCGFLQIHHLSRGVFIEERIHHSMGTQKCILWKLPRLKHGLHNARIAQLK